MKWMYATICIFLLFTSEGFAREKSVKGMPACMTVAAMNQFYTASLKKDMAAINYLLEKSCLFPEEGTDYSVVGYPDENTAQIFLYVKGETYTVYTLKFSPFIKN